MRKHFLILMLLALLPFTTWAADAPAIGTFVGQTVMVNGKPGVVTYKVNGALVTGTSGTKFYPVTITGLDADGLSQLGDNIALEIPVSFYEKYGDSKYNYAVTQIVDGLNGTTPQAFYGLTQITSLKFIPYYTKDADNNEVIAVPVTDFTYNVGTAGQTLGQAGMTFYGCTSLATLEFTENCASIAQYSFQNTAISSFVIPKQCGTIEPYAFYNCQSLNSVTVAEGNTALHALAGYVFGNSSLTTLNLTNAEQLWTIGTLDGANWLSPFMYPLSIVNDVLTTVTLPESVREINTSFAKCTALTAINGLAGTSLSAPADATTGAPAGTHIINGAFEGCRSLTALNFPDCDIEGVPFVGCKSLATITFVDGYSHTIFKGMTIPTDYNLFGVKDPMTAGYVAADQSALKTLTFKAKAADPAKGFKGVIADGAFVGVKSLETVEFNEALTAGATIGSAFTGVASLATLTFNGINSNNEASTAAPVTIGTDAFAATGIQKLDFKGIQITGSKAGRTVTIKGGAFAACENLDEVKFGDFTISKPESVVIEKDAFVSNPALAKVIFGATTFGDKGKVEIYDGAFTGNSALEKVEFGVITSTKQGTFFIGADDDAISGNPTQMTTSAETPVLVFGDGEHLKKVTFAAAEGGVFISGGAFASTGLENVTFGDIKASADGTSSGFIIGQSAFEGGNTTVGKTVTFGTIKDNTKPLSLLIFQDAFAAKMLKSVEFGQIEATNVVIYKNAFANANVADLATGLEANLATQNLQTVKFAGIKAGVATAGSQIVIREAAFWGGKAANKTVTIGKIEDNSTKQLNLTIEQNAFAAEKLYNVTIAENGINAYQVKIGENAFANMTNYGWATVPATQNLQIVKIGNITACNFEIAKKAFWGGNVADKAVTIGAIKDVTGKNTNVKIAENAFVAQSLKNVTIGEAGMSATLIQIGENAFSNKENAGAVPATQNLQTVTLGEIKAGNGASTFEAKKQAFWGGNVATKAVKIGAIIDASTTATLTASFGEAVAKANNLASVEIGNMTATSVAIGNNAFEGGKLATVTLGDMTAPTLTVGEYAFACDNATDVIPETVTIGELKTANFTSTNAKAFQGPQAEGSALNVSIAEISGAVTIPANTFFAPVNGLATYTVEGDLAAGAAANIAAYAFIGSQDADGNNTTSVKFQGDYKANIEKAAFTNVKDVEIAVAEDGSAKDVVGNVYVRSFSGAEKVTVGNLTGNNFYGTAGAAGNIAEINFLGNVQGAGVIQNFVSTKVRKINFANVDKANVKVTAKAIAAKAFEAAATAAAASGENISVIYREAQTDQAQNIFDQDAFVDPASTTYPEDEKVVTLYTTEWTKANIYESQASALNWKVYRLTLSASEVAPGEDINVKVGKRATDVYAYGKLYLPKGPAMKYKVNAEVEGTGTDAVNNVQLYYGRIDKQNNAIYMHSLPTIDGAYWIDATEVDQAFLVRTKGKESGTVITAEMVTAAEDAKFAADVTGDYVYFDKSFAKYNQFRYNTQKIASQNLKNDEEFFDRDVYYLANPVNRGFAFIQANKDHDMAANSLYLTGKLATVDGHVNVIFDTDEENSETTGIENVNVENNNDAIYNLQGVRVNGTAKGLFIQNGKKYVVK